MLQAQKADNLLAIVKSGAPPGLRFLSPAPGLSDQRDVRVVVSIDDRGGGIGKVEWRLNGTLLGLDSGGRGLELTSDASTKVERTFTLSPGENVLEVTGYNGDNKIASDPASLELVLKDAISEKPALYVLAVGINKYRDGSLVLLDTCNSGSFVQAQAVARGMAEKTAIAQLTRATGRATLAASSDAQVALEGHQGHGVFTFALIEALTSADRKHGNSDSVVTTSEVAAFVNGFVPELTYKRWGYEQVPQVNLHGREFPLGAAR